MEPFPSIRPRRSGKSIELTQLMFTAFVDYQMMVARWYAVILARNGSIRVVAQTKLLESTSGLYQMPC